MNIVRECVRVCKKRQRLKCWSAARMAGSWVLPPSSKYARRVGNSNSKLQR